MSEVYTHPANGELARTILELGSDDVTVRDAASERILKFGDFAVPDLLVATKSKDAEVRRRAQRALDSIVFVPDDSVSILETCNIKGVDYYVSCMSPDDRKLYKERVYGSLSYSPDVDAAAARMFINELRGKGFADVSIKEIISLRAPHTHYHTFRDCFPINYYGMSSKPGAGARGLLGRMVGCLVP